MVQAVPRATIDPFGAPIVDDSARERTLSALLGEFACTLITELPIPGILDHFVKRIVAVLPITSAGVTLISEGSAPHYVAASDDAALRFEKLQSNIAEGPCVRAFQSGQPVVVPDLREELRFPKFVPAAVTAGLAAVFTFPLGKGDGRLGALDLYRDTPGELDAHDMAAAQTLADVAAAFLKNATARDDALMASELCQRNAFHDPLTGLVNRPLLQDRIEHAAQIANGTGAAAAIIFVKMTSLIRINDVHGRQLVDQLLRAVAQRLTDALNSADTLARFGDDSFVILCENMKGAREVDEVATRIDTALLEPFALIGADRPIELTTTIGIAFAGPADEMCNDLLLKADTEMRNPQHEYNAPHRIVDLRVAIDVSPCATPARGRGPSTSTPPAPVMT